MRLILSYIFCSIVSFSVLAQVQGDMEQTDSTQQNNLQAEQQKVPASFYIPTGIRIGTDLVALGVNIFSNNRERYEIQADIDFHRIYLSGSYGIQEYILGGKNFFYENEGRYFRIGLSADFLKFDPDHNTLTFGLRYAQANWSETLLTNSLSRIYGPSQESLTNDNVNARWFEMTAGLRVMILKNVYMGYNFRIQLNRKISTSDQFRSYDIPGFGRAEFTSRWAFNYYLAYRISWKEKAIMERTK